MTDKLKRNAEQQTKCNMATCVLRAMNHALGCQHSCSIFVIAGGNTESDLHNFGQPLRPLRNTNERNQTKPKHKCQNPTFCDNVKAESRRRADERSRSTERRHQDETNKTIHLPSTKISIKIQIHKIRKSIYMYV